MAFSPGTLLSIRREPKVVRRPLVLRSSLTHHGRLELPGFTSLTAVEIASGVAERELSAAEVTRAFLARIDALNPAINAICTPKSGDTSGGRQNRP